MSRPSGSKNKVPNARFGTRRPPQPELVEQWKRRLADDTASEACDEIIRARPIPVPLLDVLARTDAA